jgi:hypothetical protein
MASIIDNFWCKILRGSTKSERFFILLQIFSKSEIGKLYVSILAHHNILRFKISINDTFSMQVPHTNSHLCHIELGLLLCKVSSFFQMEVKLSTPHEIHNKEHSLRSLKDIMHIDKKRMLTIHENFFLE